MASPINLTKLSPERRAIRKRQREKGEEATARAQEKFDRDRVAHDALAAKDRAAGAVRLGEQKLAATAPPSKRQTASSSGSGRGRRASAIAARVSARRDNVLPYPLNPRFPNRAMACRRLRRERSGTGPLWKPPRQSHRHRRTRSRRRRCPISRARHRANRANRRSRASRSGGSRPLGRLSLFTGRTRRVVSHGLAPPPYLAATADG